MSNFVTDNPPLPAPKSDLRPLALTADPNKNITADEWNYLWQSMGDLRDAIVAGQTNFNAWGFLGDSGINSMGVLTTAAVRWNELTDDLHTTAIPDSRAVINTIYSVASTEPLTMVDLGTTNLLPHRIDSTGPGYGFEASAGRALFDLINGVGTAPTANNRPWLLVAGISGVELKQTLPGSTYGASSPALGGLNWYNFVKTRWQALLATGGRKLAGVFLGSLAGNDSSNSTDAGNVDVNMVTLATQLRADFGQQLAIVWLELHAQANVDPTNRATVRAKQVAGIAQIPNSKLLSIDSYPLLSDGLHWGADTVWDMGLQQAEAMRKLRGILSRRVTQPTLVGYGTPAYNNAAGALAPRGYPLAIAGDIELMFVGAVKESGGATASSGWTASGWTLLASGAQAISGTTQEFALLSRNLSQADLDANGGLPPPVSITTGNDDNCAFRVAVRGASGIDGSVVLFAATSFGTGGVNASGPTAGAGSLVLTFVTSFGGGASPAEHYTAANATTNPVLVVDAPLAQNTTNYCLLALFAGRAPGGGTGTDVVTPSISTNPSGFRLALKP